MTLKVEKSTTLEDDKKESDKTKIFIIAIPQKSTFCQMSLDLVVGFWAQILLGKGLNKRIFVCIYQHLVKLWGIL